MPLAAVRTPAFVASAIAEGLGLSDDTVLDLPRRSAACADRPSPCWCSTISSRYWTRRRWSSIFLHRSCRSECWRPAGLRPELGERDMPSDLSSWQLMRMRCRPRIWACSPAVRPSWSGFGTSTRLSTHVRERPHRGSDLFLAGCPAARDRARSPVDESADGQDLPADWGTTFYCRPPDRATCPNASRR